VTVVFSLLALSASIFSAPAQEENPLVWSAPVKIKRVKKPDRVRPKPPPPRQTIPLLTLQWRLIKLVDKDVTEEVNPENVFKTGDQFRIAITVNQDGFLYLIHHMDGEDGTVIFPDPQVNDGRNKVSKNVEYLVPRSCAFIADPKNCWIEMDENPGTENFLVIFSRDEISTLPNEAAKPSGTVENKVLERLTTASLQKVETITGRLTLPGQHEAPLYATRVQNTNKDDNEELIATIQLKHGQ
jgi:hypothetical protein